MNFNIKQLTLLFIAVFVLGACSSGPKFSDISGKEWLLTEIRLPDNSVVFDRSTLKSEGFGNIFTLNFDAERLSGTGAPNKYFAPFTVDKKQVIKVQMIAGTLMAPLREPEKLKERDYFDYLQNAYKWNFTGTEFELFSKDKNGTEVTMVYKL